MFSTDAQGRLAYAPFRHYQLPEIVGVQVDDHARPQRVEFARKEGDTDGDGFGPPMFRRPLYRLRWPGETSRPDCEIPNTLVDTWRERQEWIGTKSRPTTVSDVLRWGSPLPEELAYHMAINWEQLEIEPPAVVGLPAARVAQVLDARFALDQSALAALKYLKWQAEGLRDCPFFGGFDTNIRETLYGLQQEAVRLFFYLVADYRYDADSRWWDRGMSRFVWQRLATYFHWVGRTGRGLYDNFSHIVPAEGIRPDVVAHEMQDVLDQIARDRIDYVADVPGISAEPEEGPSLGDTST